MNAELRDRLTPLLIALPVGLIAAALAIGAANQDLVAALAVIGGLLFFAAAYTRPLWMIYVAVLAIPLEFAVEQFGAVALSPTKVVLLGTAAVWVVRQIIQGRPLIADSPLTIPMLIATILILPGVLLAAEPLAVAKHFVIWCACVCLFQAVLQEGDERFVKGLLIVLALAGAALGGLAIQDTGFQNQQSFGGGQTVSGRADGGLSGPNALASLLVITSLAAVSQIFSNDNRVRVLALGCAGVALAGMLLTQSRGGFIGVAAGLMILVTWRPMRRAAIAAIVLLAVLSLAGVNPLVDYLGESAVVDRVTSITDGTALKSDPRVAVYQATLGVIGDNPVFGVGTNDYRSAAADYGIATLGVAVTHAHNVPLTVTAERGLLGMAGFLFLAVVLARVLIREMSASTGSRRGLITGITAMFVGFAAHGLVDFNLSYAVLLGVMFVLAGAAAALRRERIAAEAPIPDTAARWQPLPRATPQPAGA